MSSPALKTAAAPGFWSRFDYQHATFSGDGGRVGNPRKKFLAADAKEIRIEGSPVNGGNHGPLRVSGAAGAGAKLLYGVMLFANQASILAMVRADVLGKLGAMIEAVAPPRGQGGVLVSYSVERTGQPDGMGQHPGSYGHEIAFLGTGKTSLEVYRRVMEGPTTIGNPRPDAAPVRPGLTRTICYLWLFRR